MNLHRRLPVVVSHPSRAARMRGQSMSEYLIITALVAVAGIGVAALFGEAIHNQMSAMALELAGQSGDAAQAKAETQAKAAATAAAVHKTLDNYASANAQ